ncbi:Uncharacterised protein [Mycobacteroides abscessus subsp. abscessus]|nr:Uncharacterised protein [Mycobacteroides abscessus subsp. abscessus]
MATSTTREQALRRLPLSYSLALRLRDASVAPDVICEYVGVEPSALAGIYRIGEAKLAAAQHEESA